MKSNQPIQFVRSLTITVLSCVALTLPANLHAQDSKISQRLFSSPDEAITALRTATESKDKTALNKIFGPEFRELLTGDEVLDANNAKGFAAALAQGCDPVRKGNDKITFEIGTNKWPMPIPLVKVRGKWHFDTAAGKEEIINRHIGKDELHAIGVCRAYVLAQQQYANANPKVGGGAAYAQKFKSSPGLKDGLYWPAVTNEPASPFGPLVAEAHAEGYATNSTTAGPHPFHGYYFRILTKQGDAAPGGKMDYMSQGVLAGGFALVAYPELWDHSGIMTFMVNQDGKIVQRNLGENTLQVAGTMMEYNPDSEWMPVQDEGLIGAVTEK